MTKLSGEEKALDKPTCISRLQRLQGSPPSLRELWK